MKYLKTGLFLLGVFCGAWWSVAPATAVGIPCFGECLQTSAAEVIGNQDNTTVGVEFLVNAPIIVTALGIYDSDHNGITNSLTAYLMSSLGGAPLAQATFHGVYPLIGPGSNYGYQPIIPLVLSPGQYFLGGFGWSVADPEHNCNVNGLCEVFTTSTLVTYLGTRWNFGNLGPTLPSQDSGSPNWFEAANMEFSAATPVPAALPLFATGLGVMGLLRWRKKRKAAAALAAA